MNVFQMVLDCIVICISFIVLQHIVDDNQCKWKRLATLGQIRQVVVMSGPCVERMRTRSGHKGVRKSDTPVSKKHCTKSIIHIPKKSIMHFIYCIHKMHICIDYTMWHTHTHTLGQRGRKTVYTRTTTNGLRISNLKFRFYDENE